MYPEIKILVEDPKLLPLRAHPTDAGADLFSKDNAVVMPLSDQPTMVDTGVAVAIPKGYVGLIFNRSGQGKKLVSLPNAVGVIDSDYRGNIKVMLENHGSVPYEIKAYETRIAQLVVVPIVLPTFIQSTKDNWNDTDRGEKGFGSTG